MTDGWEWFGKEPWEILEKLLVDPYERILDSLKELRIFLIKPHILLKIHVFYRVESCG